MTVNFELDEYNIYNELWSGGRDTLDDLTVKEVAEVLQYLEDAFCGEISLTDINNFFWFERDTIASLLGYDDYDELMARDK